MTGADARGGSRRGALRVVLGDQLDRRISALRGLDPACDRVLMIEVAEEAAYVPHHPKKLVLILSAMRHFAAALREDGIAVDYVALDDPANTGSFAGELARAVRRHRPARVVLTDPGEYRVEASLRGFAREAGLPVEMLADDRFFASRAFCRDWLDGRRRPRMEHFYRDMRRRHGVLLEPDGNPSGGRWNFDAENRKRLPAGFVAPPAFRVAPDDTTRAVIDLVRRRFPGRFGDAVPFWFATTAADAERALDHFIVHGLARFGDWQDAMAAGEPFLAHSLLSLYLNLGLLRPREVVARAEAAYRAGDVPINAAEGFIRQILGWREYVRGIYWSRMPAYAETNALAADRPLPSFYWTGETPMRCLAEVIGQTRREAYAHHIQRLMVTGNFALLLGVRPAELEAWYLAVYADAFEWVELPNTHGMVAYADGGLLASKPYAASGAYIDRMSDYCAGCRFDVKQKLGPDACPFNYLYWAFLDRNEARLQHNPRLAMPYRTLRAMPAARRQAIRQAAESFGRGLDRRAAA